MQLFIKKQIGKTTHTFTVEGKNLFDLQIEAQKLSFPDIHKCGLCGSDSIFLNAHTAKKKFNYVTIKCAKCKGSVNFGQQMENPDIFYIKTKEGTKDFDWKAMTSAE